jgi:hypothetical protein
MIPKSKFTVGPRNSRPVFWILCCFTSVFLVNVHLIPTQIYGSTLSCFPPANLTNCVDQSTASPTDASAPSETPLVLPDISPDRDDLTASTTPEGNLAANEIDRDEATNMDTDEDDQNQINDDDDDDDDDDASTDSGDRKSRSSDDSGPYLLPFP